MSSEVIVRGLTDRQRELISVIHFENEAFRDNMSEALVHAFRIGDALLECRKSLPRGQWSTWIEQNLPEINVSSAFHFQRLAAFKGEIMEWIGESGGELPTLRQVEDFLRSRGLTFGHVSGTPVYDEDMKVEARRLRKTGTPVAEIAEKFGISNVSVYAWTDPKQYAKKREYARKRWAERRALEEKRKRDEAKSLAREAGGRLAKAYANLRRLLDDLQGAKDEYADREVQSMIHAAMTRGMLVEESIVGVLTHLRANRP